MTVRADSVRERRYWSLPARNTATTGTPPSRPCGACCPNRSPRTWSRTCRCARLSRSLQRDRRVGREGDPRGRAAHVRGRFRGAHRTFPRGLLAQQPGRAVCGRGRPARRSRPPAGGAAERDRRRWCARAHAAGLPTPMPGMGVAVLRHARGAQHSTVASRSAAPPAGGRLDVPATSAAYGASGLLCQKSSRKRSVCPRNRPRTCAARPGGRLRGQRDDRAGVDAAGEQRAQRHVRDQVRGDRFGQQAPHGLDGGVPVVAVFRAGSDQ